MMQAKSLQDQAVIAKLSALLVEDLVLIEERKIIIQKQEQKYEAIIADLEQKILALEQRNQRKPQQQEQN